MSLAAETRRAVDRRPFLRRALQAGVLNYSAAARFLDIGEDEAAVGAALRRYVEDLPDYSESSRRIRVTMTSGVGIAETDIGSALSIEGRGVTDDGDATALVGRGSVDAVALAAGLECLEAEGIDVLGAGLLEDRCVVVVPGDVGPQALRTLEAAWAVVPAGDGTA